MGRKHRPWAVVEGVVRTAPPHPSRGCVTYMVHIVKIAGRQLMDRVMSSENGDFEVGSRTRQSFLRMTFTTPSVAFYSKPLKKPASQTK